MLERNVQQKSGKCHTKRKIDSERKERIFFTWNDLHNFRRVFSIVGSLFCWNNYWGRIAERCDHVMTFLLIIQPHAHTYTEFMRLSGFFLR